MRFRKLLPLCFVTAGTALAFTAHDVLNDVGATITEVKKQTVEQVYKAEYALPYIQPKVRNACKALPPGVREATMISLGKVVKDYVNSPEFEKDYFALIEKNRRYNSPLPDDEKTAAERKRREAYYLSQFTRDQLSAEGARMYLNGHLQLAESMLKLLKDNPDMPLGKLTKADFEHMQKEVNRIRPLEQSDPEAYRKAYVSYKVDQELRSEQQSKTQDREREQNQIAKQRDHKAVIRKQLARFLEESAQVNFKAATRQEGKKTVFVDPAYEAMSPEWKFYFRCGPEAIGGARKFAQQWLKELN